ncbi:MAG: dihydrolipoyl dehydrogenase [Candidatus Nanohaloarchaea archaeon]
MVVGDIETGTELLVIGGGPGGYSAAIRAGQMGVDVTLVEKEDIGGTCLNRGCIPAKALIHAAEVEEEVEAWREIGIHSENLDTDLKELQAWKNGVVEKLNKGVKNKLESVGVEIIKGEARFIDDSTVRVEQEHRTDKLNFDECVVATGSKPIEVPGLEFEKEGVISSRELLNLDEAPEELVVVGGGYIGMEAATKFGSFGSIVKIVEAEEQILPNFDEEVVEELQEASDTYSDEVYTDTKAVEVKEGERPVLVAEKDGEKVEIKGDYILVAVGRETRSNLESVELANTGVEINENGFVETDPQMKASENIFVIGDAARGPLLAHKAYMEGKTVGEVAAGESTGMDSQYIPEVMYTDPEVATVGLSEEEAQESHENVKVGRFPMKYSGRALTTNTPKGYAKVVASENNKILGAAFVANRASDMVAEATLALELQAYLKDVTGTVHAHPTFSEAFMEACEDALGKSIHT